MKTNTILLPIHPKYSQLILESKLKKDFERNTFIKNIGSTFDFLVYKCGMYNAVNELCKDISTEKNYNSKYQKPLELLYKKGVYSDIINNNGVYTSKRLSKVNLVLYPNGKWHPVNKLNTNSFDQAELLYDLYNKIGVFNKIPNIYEIEDLKNWVKDFNKSIDLYFLIKHYLDFTKYTRNNRLNSIKGDKSETEVENFLKSKGYDLLYKGGDGDVVDMRYGTDLIISRDDKILTVQVKSSKKAMSEAIENPKYNDIDIFANTERGIEIISKINPKINIFSKEVNKPNPNSCPKCGSKLVLRTAKKGYKIGSKFLGCSNFPNCKFTKKL